MMKSISQLTKPVFRIRGAHANDRNTEQLSGAAGRKVRGQFRESVETLIRNRWLMVDTHLNLFQHLVKVLATGAGRWW